MSTNSSQAELGSSTLSTSWRGAWQVLWPKAVAILFGLGIWHIVAISGWRPSWVLPGPIAVLGRLVDETAAGEVFNSVAITMVRAAVGFAIAVVVGTCLGLALTTSKVLRTGLASLLTGLQTMPSVAWFPLAILLFQLSEAAILSVVILGAAPSIATALLSAADHIPPLLVRAGKTLGARGWSLYRYVIIPALLPGFVGGLKQGWAFAWRSLMAGELLVIIGNRPSLGVRLQYAREFSDAEGLLAWMLVVLSIGVLIDSAGFSWLEKRIRTRRGLGLTNH